MRTSSNKQKGFTLIEAVVATGLFALTISSVLGVYMSTLRINRRTDVIRTASENARYITEYISREIKNGQIAYYPPVNSPCSTTLSASSDTLAIVNVDQDRLCFYLGDNNGQESPSGQNVWLIKNNLAAVQINSQNVKVTNLTFYVTPTYNPYTAGSTVQPRVTFTANVQTIAGAQDSGNGVIIPIESSITIPVYDIVGS